MIRKGYFVPHINFQFEQSIIIFFYFCHYLFLFFRCHSRLRSFYFFNACVFVMVSWLQKNSHKQTSWWGHELVERGRGGPLQVRAGVGLRLWLSDRAQPRLRDHPCQGVSDLCSKHTFTTGKCCTTRYGMNHKSWLHQWSHGPFPSFLCYPIIKPFIKPNLWTIT